MFTLYTKGHWLSVLCQWSNNSWSRCNLGCLLSPSYLALHPSSGLFCNLFDPRKIFRTFLPHTNVMLHWITGNMNALTEITMAEIRLPYKWYKCWDFNLINVFTWNGACLWPQWECEAFSSGHCMYISQVCSNPMPSPFAFLFNVFMIRGVQDLLSQKTASVYVC